MYNVLAIQNKNIPNIILADIFKQKSVCKHILCSMPPRWRIYFRTPVFKLILLEYKYTERQKKLITSSEWHSRKSAASKWITFGHRLGKFILNKHIKKKVYFNQRRDKCDEIARGQVSKITETACLSGWEFEADNIARTAFTQPAIEMSVLNRPPPWSSLGEQFLRFSKNYLSWF